MYSHDYNIIILMCLYAYLAEFFLFPTILYVLA